MLKRMISALLALYLLLTLLPVSALADDPAPTPPTYQEVGSIDALRSAMGTAKKGVPVYLRLTKDLTDPRPSGENADRPNLLVLEGCSVVLDLCGKNLTLNSPPPSVVGNIYVAGTLTIEDSTAADEAAFSVIQREVVYTSGRIECRGSRGNSSGIFVDKGGVVTMKSGTVELKDSSGAAISASGEGAAVKMEGGYALNRYGTAVSVTGKDAVLSMTDGVLKGESAVSNRSNSDSEGASKITVNGGEIVGTAFGIEQDQPGSLTVTKGSIYAYDAVGIQINRGKLEMGKDSAISVRKPGIEYDDNVDIPRYIMVERVLPPDKEDTADKINADVQITLANAAYAPRFSNDDGFHWAVGGDGKTFTAVKNAEITFHYGGGATETGLTDGNGESLSWPTKTDKGKECVGWSFKADGSDPAPREYRFTADTTLYAIWKPITVTFAPDRNSDPAQRTEVTVGEDFRVADWPKPEKKGYALTGWSWDPSGRQMVPADHEFTSSALLYAQWTPIKVKFMNGEATYKTAAVSEATGKVSPMPKDPVHKDPNFSFLGWRFEGETDVYEGISEYVFTADTTLYAVWKEAEKVTVSFDPNYAGAPAIEDREVYKDKTLSNPPTPASRGGYAFKGWLESPEGTEPVKFNEYTFIADTTLYALWNPIKVTFKLDKDTEASVETVNSSNLVSPWPADPVRAGYNFKGWFTSLTGGAERGSGHAFPADATLFARWEPRTRKVSFDPNYEGAPASSYIKDRLTNADGKIVPWPSAPSRPDYLFGGWFQDSAGAGEAVPSEYVFTADATVLFARWDNFPTSTVTFRLNYEGAPEAPAPMATGQGGKLGSLPADPAREGWTFSGWYTAAEGGSKISASYVFLKDTDVYAHWTDTPAEDPKDPDKPSDPSNPDKPDDPSKPSDPSNPGSSYHRVYVPDRVSGGTFSVSPTYAYANTRVTITLRPRSNYELDKLEVTDLTTGRALRLTELYADEFTFTMPEGDVNVELTYQRRGSGGGGFYIPEEPVAPQTGWRYQGGRISTVAGEQASDRTLLTRDMLLSILYNREGGGAEGFQVWATNSGIVPNYYEAGFYGTDKPLTREQTALLLYSYAQHKGYNTAQRARLTGYSDYGEVRPIAQTAMSWARGANLLNGTSATTLSPTANLTCAQACVLLERFASNVSWGW